MAAPMARGMMKCWRIISITSRTTACLRTPKLKPLNIAGCCSARQYCSNGDDPKPKSKLDLAKPGRAKKLRKQVLERAPKPELSEEEKLEQAAKAVADSMPGDHAQQTESDLLQKLREHSTMTKAQKDGQAPPATSLSNVIKGMRVDRRPSRRRGFTETEESDKKWSLQDRYKRHDKFDQGDEGWRPRRARHDVRLSETSDLGIFPARDTTKTGVPAKQPNLYEILEAEEKQQEMNYPPVNAFEDMITMTKQGKLWKFPIDNEQGWEEEANVGFHEHVFLDHMLEDFPKKGPVRHFMELVVVGLSKNPYLTVHQKQEHVDWFKNYFADKYEMIDAMIVEEQKQ